MSEYVKVCKYCKQEIKMSDNGGKWNPYNKDGSAHDCREKTNQPKMEITSREASIEAVIKKVQSVITDLEALKQ